MARERKVLEQRLATLLHETEPLDEYQQDEVVETMETLHTYHDKHWTLAFSVLSIILSLGFVVDAGAQVLYPFEAKHRAIWQPYLSSPALIGCEIVYAACLLFCFFAVYKRGKNREDGFSWTPVSLVLVCCSFFSLFMIILLISKSKEYGESWIQAKLLWLPMLPTLYCVLIYYVVSLLENSFRDLKKLKQRKYTFKAI